MSAKLIQKSFGEVNDKFLAELYQQFGSCSAQQKISLLQQKLGGEYHLYGRGGSVSDHTHLSCLEFEYLRELGRIELTLF